jgi:hypothetical protein
VDEQGREYWDAHELAKLLGYTQYQNFKRALRKAEISIRECGEQPSEHLILVNEMSQGGQGAMGSDELIANAFRASLARQRLQREKTKDREKAYQIHFQVGRDVRRTIIEQGGTVPEELPTPQKSFQELEREEQKRLKQGPQRPLFDLDSGQKDTEA